MAGFVTFANALLSADKVLAQGLHSSANTDDGIGGAADFTTQTFTSTGINSDSIAAINYDISSDEAALNTAGYFSIRATKNLTKDGGTFTKGTLFEFDDGISFVIDSNGDYVINFGTLSDDVPITIQQKPDQFEIVIDWDASDVLIFVDFLMVAKLSTVDWGDNFGKLYIGNDVGGNDSLEGNRLDNLILLKASQGFVSTGEKIAWLGDSFIAQGGLAAFLRAPSKTGYSGNNTVVPWRTYTWDSAGTTEYEEGTGYASGEAGNTAEFASFTQTDLNLDGGVIAQFFRVLAKNGIFPWETEQNRHYGKSGARLGAAGSVHGQVQQWDKLLLSNSTDGYLPTHVISVGGANDIISGHPLNGLDFGNGTVLIVAIVALGTVRDWFLTTAVSLSNESQYNTEPIRNETHGYNRVVDTELIDYESKIGRDTFIKVVAQWKGFGGEAFNTGDLQSNNLHLSNPQGSTKYGNLLGNAFIERVTLVATIGYTGTDPTSLTGASTVSTSGSTNNNITSSISTDSVYTANGTESIDQAWFIGQSNSGVFGRDIKIALYTAVFDSGDSRWEPVALVSTAILTIDDSAAEPTDTGGQPNIKTVDVTPFTLVSGTTYITAVTADGGYTFRNENGVTGFTNLVDNSEAANTMGDPWEVTSTGLFDIAVGFRFTMPPPLTAALMIPLTG